MSVPRHFCQRPLRSRVLLPHPLHAVEAPVVEVAVVEVPVVEVPKVKTSKVKKPPVVEPEVSVVEPEVSVAETPATVDLSLTDPPVESLGEGEWHSTMKKADLLKIAQDKGLDVSESNTKAEILSALDKAEI